MVTSTRGITGQPLTSATEHANRVFSHASRTDHGRHAGSARDRICERPALDDPPHQGIVGAPGLRLRRVPSVPLAVLGEQVTRCRRIDLDTSPKSVDRGVDRARLRSGRVPPDLGEQLVPWHRTLGPFGEIPQERGLAHRDLRRFVATHHDSCPQIDEAVCEGYASAVGYVVGHGAAVPWTLIVHGARGGASESASGEFPGCACRPDSLHHTVRSITLIEGSGEYRGDGVVNGPEDCDGDMFRDSCESLGWESGELSCVQCLASTHAWTGAFCGDGVVEGDEECDHGGSPQFRCEYGTASCTVCGRGCVLTDAEGAWCGDGVVNRDDDEVCDPGRNRECRGGEATVSRCADDCRSSDTIHCEPDAGEDPETGRSDADSSDDADTPCIDDDAVLSDAGADDSLSDAAGAEPDAPAERSTEGGSGCSAAPRPTAGLLAAFASLAALLRRRGPTSRPTV